jgi:hypothetical protein
MQIASFLHSVILSPVAPLVLPYFFTLSHDRHDFGGKKKLYGIKCVFWFSLQLLSETFLILRRIQRDIITNVHRSSRQVSLILVRFYWYLHFRDRFSYSFQIPNLTRIRPLGAEFFHADGQTTDLTMLKYSLFKILRRRPKVTVR